jgi:Polysulphide reductase, NrfD
VTGCWRSTLRLVAGGTGSRADRAAAAGPGAKIGAAGAASLSLAALIKDLERPTRFVNMLRVFKPTSPMSVGTWILSGYVPATLAAAASDVTGLYGPVGLLSTAGAALLGPAVASYTAVLVSDTAVPAWHEARHVMPFLFVASAAAAAAGLGLISVADGEAGPMYRLAVAGALGELAAQELLEHRLDPVSGAVTWKAGRPSCCASVRRWPSPAPWEPWPVSGPAAVPSVWAPGSPYWPPGLYQVWGV